jgi:hypothetical protein
MDKFGEVFIDLVIFDEHGYVADAKPGLDLGADPSREARDKGERAFKRLVKEDPSMNYDPSNGVSPPISTGYYIFGARCQGTPSKITVFDSRYGNSPSIPPSRPIPDCLKPPKAMLNSAL